MKGPLDSDTHIFVCLCVAKLTSLMHQIQVLHLEIRYSLGRILTFWLENSWQWFKVQFSLSESNLRWHNLSMANRSIFRKQKFGQISIFYRKAKVTQSWTNFEFQILNFLWSEETGSRWKHFSEVMKFGSNHIYCLQCTPSAVYIRLESMLLHHGLPPLWKFFFKNKSTFSAHSL